MFKFSSEPGPRPGASGQLRQKFFNDFGRLTTSSLPFELQPHHTHVGRSRHLHAARLRPALRSPLCLAASTSLSSRICLSLPLSLSLCVSWFLGLLTTPFPRKTCQLSTGLPGFLCTPLPCPHPPPAAPLQPFACGRTAKLCGHAASPGLSPLRDTVAGKTRPRP